MEGYASPRGVRVYLLYCIDVHRYDIRFSPDDLNLISLLENTSIYGQEKSFHTIILRPLTGSNNAAEINKRGDRMRCSSVVIFPSLKIKYLSPQEIFPLRLGISRLRIWFF